MSFFNVPRRYDFSVPTVTKLELNELTKSGRLNYIIKHFVLIYLSALHVEESYRIAGDTLYALDTDTVVNNTLIITSGKGTVEGDRLTLQ